MRSKGVDEYGLQSVESTSNECTVCFSDYHDDLFPDGYPVQVMTPTNGCMKTTYVGKNNAGNYVRLTIILLSDYKLMLNLDNFCSVLSTEI